MWILGFVSVLNICQGASGEIHYRDYSDAKKKAYQYLMGDSKGDMSYIPFSPPPVPPTLPYANRNAKTTTFMDEIIKEGLFEFLADQDLREFWDRCFHELGVWSTVSPSSEDFERLKPFVLAIEGASMKASDKLEYLHVAYGAVARTGTPAAKAFLRARMHKAFWGGKMPHSTTSISPVGLTHFRSAQKSALLASIVLGDDESVSHLRALSQTSEIQEDSELSEAVRYAIDHAAEGKRMVEQDKAYYRFVRSEPTSSSK
ncbi:MAG: hypothetical protein QOE70_894 [Chthoniobacter sp.]|jgi:hypothetical protein|nr:hypothetical protein [Chthoniobacter sp.]